MRSPPGLIGTIFSEEEKEKARTSCRLLFISLMTDQVCNLRCLDCYIGEKELKGNELTLDERKSVLNQSKSLGAKTLRITGEGEPLLDKTFFPLIEYATNELGFNVFFFTNGILINNKTASQLYKNPKISLATKFSGPPKVMEKLTGNKGYFGGNKFVEHDGLLIPKTLKILVDKGLNELDKKGNSKLGIEFLLRKSNYGYALDIFRWSRRNNIIPYMEQVLESGRAWEFLDERVKDSDAFALSKILFNIDKKEFGFTWKPSIPYLVGGICESEKKGCKKFTYNLVVSSTGEMNLCYATHFSLGNIREKTLKEGLEHPIRKNLLKNPVYNCLCRVYSKTQKSIKGIGSLDKSMDYKDKY